MTGLPKATIDKEQDMSKNPLSAEQRFYLWLALIIVGGVGFAAVAITYLVVR